MQTVLLLLRVHKVMERGVQVFLTGSRRMNAVAIVGPPRGLGLGDRAITESVDVSRSRALDAGGRGGLLRRVGALALRKELLQAEALPPVLGPAVGHLVKQLKHLGPRVSPAELARSGMSLGLKPAPTRPPGVNTELRNNPSVPKARSERLLIRAIISPGVLADGSKSRALPPFVSDGLGGLATEGAAIVLHDSSGAKAPLGPDTDRVDPMQDHETHVIKLGKEMLVIPSAHNAVSLNHGSSTLGPSLPASSGHGHGQGSQVLKGAAHEIKLLYARTSDVPLHVYAVSSSGKRANEQTDRARMLAFFVETGLLRGGIKFRLESIVSGITVSLKGGNHVITQVRSLIPEPANGGEASFHDKHFWINVTGSCVEGHVH